MPRFYFHVFNSIEARDMQGTEFPNLFAARKKAVQGVRELIAEEIKLKGQLYLSHYLEIEDEFGTITPLRFGDCVEVNP